MNEKTPFSYYFNILIILLLLLIVIICYHVFWQDKSILVDHGECCQTYQDCSTLPFADVYYPGVIRFRANKDFSNGVISALDVFENDDDFETSGRAIIYKRSLRKKAFNLNDTVVFKARFVNGLLIAYNVMEGKTNSGHWPLNSKKIGNNRTISGSSFDIIDSLDVLGNRFDNYETYAFNIVNGEAQSIIPFATMTEILKMRDYYELNLHNGDVHREGPQHKKNHIRPNKIYLSTACVPTIKPEYGHYAFVTTYDQEHCIIYDPNNVPEGLDYEYYLYEKEIPADLDTTCFNTIPFFRGDEKIYDISSIHDHTLQF